MNSLQMEQSSLIYNLLRAELRFCEKLHRVTALFSRSHDNGATMQNVQVIWVFYANSVATSRHAACSVEEFVLSKIKYTEIPI
jgi:hypothetical protein